MLQVNDDTNEQWGTHTPQKYNNTKRANFSFATF
jgi:hypothetical protein